MHRYIQQTTYLKLLLFLSDIFLQIISIIYKSQLFCEHKGWVYILEQYIKTQIYQYQVHLVGETVLIMSTKV